MYRVGFKLVVVAVFFGNRDFLFGFDIFYNFLRERQELDYFRFLGNCRMKVVVYNIDFAVLVGLVELG